MDLREQVDAALRSVPDLITAATDGTVHYRLTKAVEAVVAAVDPLLAAKDAEIERLVDEASNAVATAIANQATFKSLSVEEGAAVLELGSPRELVIAWVDAARKMLGDAENYSETRIDFPAVSMELKAAGELDRYVFTVQRAGKLTPHEARMRAESSRRDWAAEAMRLEMAFNEATRLIGEEITWQKHAYPEIKDTTDRLAVARTIGMEDALKTLRDAFSRPVCAVHEEANECPAQTSGEADDCLCDDPAACGERYARRWHPRMGRTDVEGGAG